MSINWRERFLQIKTVDSTVFREAITIINNAGSAWNAWSEKQKENAGKDGAATAYYRFNASSSNDYPDFAKYNFALVDDKGRKRYLRPHECHELGFDYEKGTSRDIPFSKNTNDSFYQTYLREHNRLSGIQRKNMEKAREQYNQLVNQCDSKPTRKQLYDLYLQSKEWKQKRSEVLFRDGHCCQLCGDEENLRVHHLTYNRIGDEALFDLVTLCSYCHANEHGKEDEE